MNQLRLRILFACLLPISLICSSLLLCGPLPCFPLVLLYHNLTASIIKGRDIELVDIWERRWMGCEQDLLLRQIPEQMCDNVRQGIFFTEQNKLLKLVW